VIEKLAFQKQVLCLSIMMHRGVLAVHGLGILLKEGVDDALIVL
jgi:hypothetical protein